MKTPQCAWFYESALGGTASSPLSWRVRAREREERGREGGGEGERERGRERERERERERDRRGRDDKFHFYSTFNPTVKYVSKG